MLSVKGLNTEYKTQKGPAVQAAPRRRAAYCCKPSAPNIR